MNVSNRGSIDPKDRRLFLKKLAYTAPVLTALGQLARPTVVHAETSIPDPPFGILSQNRDSFDNGRSDPFESQFDK